MFFSYKVHLHSIFTVVLKQASYKKCHDNVLANFIFRTSYFLNKTILRKSKKNGPALITLLGNGVFILVKKRTDKPVSDKNHDHVWKTMHFFNLKNPGIFTFFSNSDFTINNLNLSQLWSSYQSSPTYAIKHPFVRIQLTPP